MGNSISNILRKTRLHLFLMSVTPLFLVSCDAFDLQDDQAQEEQETTETSSQDLDAEVFEVVEDPPEPVGGLHEIYENLEYPETAREAGIQGQVVIQFIVTEDGDVDQVEGLRDIGGGTMEAAKQAIKDTEWKPGEQKGRAVNVRFQLPVSFQLSEED